MHFVNAGNMGRTRNVLLMISSVPTTKGIPLTTLWDSGTNTTLIRHKTAKLLGLQGTDVFVTITKVGNETMSCESKEYVVPLVDRKGEIWHVNAIGMDEITSNVSDVSITGAARLFRGISERDITRPVGEVDFMVATACSTILPNKVNQVENLQLMVNQFGHCIRGSHSLIKQSSLNASNHIEIKLNMKW